VNACGECGWREPTPEQQRAHARASWARCDLRSTTFDVQGAA
jgi:hypothetical protein